MPIFVQVFHFFFLSTVRFLVDFVIGWDFRLNVQNFTIA